jgi:predicted metalloendopeptidase
MDKTDFFGNILRLDRWSFDTAMTQHRKETDFKEWYLNCFEVNAYYSPELNEIVFPWGILCPPFFSASYSDVKNMARLGSIVGHEIIHGFDNHGSFFDHTGNLNQWWEQTDRERFQEKTEALQKLYSNIVYRGIPVDGELTCPENIADLSGLCISFEALVKYISTSKLDKQKFFVYYAHTLCSYHSFQYHKLSSMLDTHSPASVRVNTCLGLFDEFFKAYKVYPFMSHISKKKIEIY